ncbi:uncharacterized protein AAES06_021458 [Glossophaga mutica]
MPQEFFTLKGDDARRKLRFLGMKSSKCFQDLVPPPPESEAKAPRADQLPLVYLGGRQHFAQLVNLHPGVLDLQRVLRLLFHFLQAQGPGPLAEVRRHYGAEQEGALPAKCCRPGAGQQYRLRAVHKLAKGGASPRCRRNACAEKKMRERNIDHFPNCGPGPQPSSESSESPRDLQRPTSSPEENLFGLRSELSAELGAGLGRGGAPGRELLPAGAEQPGAPTNVYTKPRFHAETKKCPKNPDDAEGRSDGQLVTDGFITTTHPLIRHISCSFSAEHLITQVTQPCYSPDLAPCDF